MLGIKKISKLKTIIVIIGWVIAVFIFLVIISPAKLTLALDKVSPTNKKSKTISGKSLSNKPVNLMQNNSVIQTTKSDSKGLFSFSLNDLKDGEYSYLVEVCNKENDSNCVTGSFILKVDQTPPSNPNSLSVVSIPDIEGEQVVIKGKAEPDSKIIVKAQDGKTSEALTNSNGEFSAKGGLVLGSNTIKVKSVDSVGNESGSETVELEFNPTKQKTKVTKVIDGDTIEIEGGKRLRYIGINTPETKHPSKPVECFAQEAYEENLKLVGNKEIIIEQDVSELDKYDRLLRYVWVGDTFVNEYLIKQGYANSSTYPPDVKYQDLFLKAEQEARNAKRGLWGDICNSPSPTLKPTSVPTKYIAPTNTQKNTYLEPTSPPVYIQPTNPPVQQIIPNTGNYICNCSKTCDEMSSCDEAYYQLNTCGCSKRDGDNDGIPCESICQ